MIVMMVVGCGKRTKTGIALEAIETKQQKPLKSQQEVYKFTFVVLRFVERCTGFESVESILNEKLVSMSRSAMNVLRESAWNKNFNTTLTRDFN